ncbi:enoyl-CoA hydratase-related protein [Caulobacter mirabilis]|uniref:Enoyl-CoA hydratase n=1 Tax=Caulobacter mirabilis TaxID=69666 RepID=A0A2D2AX92_9CAUL|nr:enoyl-CoA hydratase-related protein [Caulobacter mirabilis]ATQ42629.1 enoyl-CoA hydratase [Caulobacter mirabilis]
MTNPIADPLVEVADTDALSDTVILDASPSGVAVVMINRPDRKNAFDAEVIAALRQTFETLRDADGVRIVFLRGAGGAFSAGADLEWMRAAAGFSKDENRQDALALAEMLLALRELPQLTVALVEGPAFGGGAGLVAACDYAVALNDAKFAFSEAKLGLVAATISPHVVSAIGPRRAKSLFATARLFDAAFAEKIGLVDEVVDDVASLEATMERLSNEIMACAPGAVRASKQLVEDVAGLPIDDELLEETAKLIADRRASEEGKEGVRAFLEKRKPSWTV